MAENVNNNIGSFSRRRHLSRTKTFAGSYADEGEGGNASDDDGDEGIEEIEMEETEEMEEKKPKKNTKQQKRPILKNISNKNNDKEEKEKAMPKGCSIEEVVSKEEEEEKEDREDADDDNWEPLVDDNDDNNDEDYYYYYDKDDENSVGSNVNYDDIDDVDCTVLDNNESSVVGARQAYFSMFVGPTSIIITTNPVATTITTTTDDVIPAANAKDNASAAQSKNSSTKPTATMSTAATTQSYGTISKSLMDDIVSATSDPNVERANELLLTLVNMRQQITIEILESTKLGKVLVKAVKTCKRCKQTADDEETRSHWDVAISTAEKLLASYKTAADAEAKASKQKSAKANATVTRKSGLPSLTTSENLFFIRQHCIPHDDDRHNMSIQEMSNRPRILTREEEVGRSMGLVDKYDCPMRVFRYVVAGKVKKYHIRSSWSSPETKVFDGISEAMEYCGVTSVDKQHNDAARSRATSLGFPTTFAVAAYPYQSKNSECTHYSLFKPDGTHHTKVALAMDVYETGDESNLLAMVMSTKEMYRLFGVHPSKVSGKTVGALQRGEITSFTQGEYTVRKHSPKVPFHLGLVPGMESKLVQRLNYTIIHLHTETPMDAHWVASGDDYTTHARNKTEVAEIIGLARNNANIKRLDRENLPSQIKNKKKGEVFNVVEHDEEIHGKFKSHKNRMIEGQKTSSGKGTNEGKKKRKGGAKQVNESKKTKTKK